MIRNRYWIWFVWLVAFYGTWLTLVAGGNHWQDIGDRWGIAVAMLFGSYVAGSTPMGGGTVGFPVLVLLFGMPGSLGRNFGLAIQSIGMTSASIYIFAGHTRLETRVLKYAVLGSCIGTPFGVAFIAPFIDDLYVKLTFAIVWSSFGLMHLAKLRELIQYTSIESKWDEFVRPIGLAIGLLGGVVASITGVGIDMILYAVLMLLFRCDLKSAIPTSVVIMAITSIVGIASNAGLSLVVPDQFSIDHEVYLSWLAASPVVALGAPLGAFVVNRIPRLPTLFLVSFLCIAQFVWTAIHERLTIAQLIASLVAIALVNLGFIFLYSLGEPKTTASKESL